MRALLTLMISSLVLVPPVAAAAEPTQPKPVNLTPAQTAVAARWITAHAHRFEPGAIDGKVYADIVGALGPAKVYGLGEVTHGTHEDHQFKADLIKELVREGKIDTLALESNYTSGLAFDDYVKTGRGDPVALIRSTDFFRIWKGDEFASLLTWIRAWNLQAARPVSIVAVDLQLPAKDARIALDELALRDSRQAAEWTPAVEPFFAKGSAEAPKFGTVWTSLDNEQRALALRTAKAMLDRFNRDAATRKDPAFVRAHEAARRTWQGFSAYEYMTNDPKQDMTKVPPEASSRRDRYMAENLLRAADGATGVALWAHNSHVLANYDQAYEDMGWVTLGRVLKKTLGARYRTLGFTYSRAQVLLTSMADSTNFAMTQVNDQVATLPNDGPGTAGALLALAAQPTRADALWLIPPRPNESAAPAPVRRGDFFFGEAGWGYVPATFQKNRDDAAGAKLSSFDVLVWFRHLTPQRRWPNVPYAK